MSQKQSKPVLGKGIASLFQSNTTTQFLNDLRAQEEAPRAPQAHAVQAPPQVSKETEENNANKILMVHVDQIKANPLQPRKIFKERELDELAQSITENGIIQPLVVAKTENGFELIAGERRLRASKKAGIEYVPVIVKRVTDKQKLAVALIENIQRSELNCVEEALAYFQLMEDFHLTQEEVAKQMGKERSAVANHLRILKLPRKTIEMLQSDQLTFGHAKVLAGLKEPEKIVRLSLMAVEEGLSVRELEKRSKKDFSKAVGGAAPDRTAGFDASQLQANLERSTGFHFKVAAKPNGSGQIVIKFNNQAEFNDIYDYLLKQK